MNARLPFKSNVWRLAILLTAVPLVFLSCVTSPVTIAVVGPRPTGVSSPSAAATTPAEPSFVGTGRLVVYTATERKHVGKDTIYYVPTAYLIRTPDGKEFRWVPNHAGVMDTAPQYISVPAGKYEIAATSESYGNVVVPVVVEPARTTVIHLEGRWKPEHQPASEDDLVRLPNGETIGWRVPVASN